MLWWNFTFNALDNTALSAPDLLDLRAAMLGVARHWRNFLNGYAEGLRNGDHVRIAQSFNSLTRAEEMRARLRVAMGLKVEPLPRPALDPPRQQREMAAPRADPQSLQSAPRDVRGASDARPISDPKAQSTGTSPASAVEATPSSSDAVEVEPFVPSIPVIRADPGDMVVPIRKTAVAHHTATALLQWFEKAAAENNDDFAEYLADMEADRIRERDFFRSLKSLEFRWSTLATGLLASSEARTPELTGFRGTLLAVVGYQSSFLTGYASGLQKRDQDAITKAYAERERADRALERARLYVR
jgi:hypothetical protein